MNKEKLEELLHNPDLSLPVLYPKQLKRDSKTTCLSAWIFKEYVLFGYGCTPTQEGYQKARISGLLLGPSELEYLKTICENQELEKVFKLSEDGRAKRIISFPKNPERPEVQIQISFHPMYGKRIRRLILAQMFHRS